MKEYPLFVVFKRNTDFEVFLENLKTELKAKPCYDSYPPEIDSFSLETPRMWIGWCKQEKRVAFVPKTWELARGRKHYHLQKEMEQVETLLQKLCEEDDYCAELTAYDQGVVR